MPLSRPLAASAAVEPRASRDPTHRLKVQDNGKAEDGSPPTAPLRLRPRRALPRRHQPQQGGSR